MKISVLNKDLGFLTEKPITVQRFEFDGQEDELVWCNHAGAIEEEVDNEIPNINGRDIAWTDRVLVCKFGAYRFLEQDNWQDAPIEGSHEL